MSRIYLISAAAVIAVAGCANTGSTRTGGPSAFDQRLLGPEIRTTDALLASIYAFLSYQCGADTPDSEFGLAVAQLPREATAIFRTILRDGPPREARAIASDQAQARFERRQAWLRENGQALFGAETERLLARDRAAYVEDALKAVDSQYRQNAIRALSYVGGSDAREAITAAAAARPDLAPMAAIAIDRLNKRSPDLD